MELHTPDGELLVLDAHDFALVRFGGDFQAIGQGVALNHQGMITGGGKWIGHILEKLLAVVLDQRSLAVHHAEIDHHVAAEDVANALVPQTNA